MKLHPFNEVVQSALDILDQGGHFHQQFTCATCGTKQTMEQPDVMFTKGNCEECGRTTDIYKVGCNILAIFWPGTDK